MQTLLVTGALGDVGRWAVDRLAEHYDLFCVDLERPDDPREDVDYRAADLSDPGAAWELVATAEPDAVLHLAAIPRVGVTTGSDTFRTNVNAAYNVLTAAGEAGVPTVWTSSEAAYGMAFADEPYLPEYFPIDTDHPMEPEDPYGTSKIASEAVADMVARRCDVPVTSIRPSWVQEPGDYELTAERREAFELHDPTPVAGNFWSYVDVRDLIELFHLAIDASLAGDLAGHNVYNAVAEDSYLDVDTADAIRAAFGGLPERCDLEGRQSAFSHDGATRDLGWEPRRTWETAQDVPVPEPRL